MSIDPCSISQSLYIIGGFLAIMVSIVAFMNRAQHRADLAQEERQREQLSSWYAQSGKAMRAVDL